MKHLPQLVLSLLVLALLATALPACKRTAPSPWREMTLPLTNGEILPGATAEKLTVMYRGMSKEKAYLREYRQSLEGAGFKYDKDGRDHDVISHTYVLVFKKGEDLVRLTIQGGDGNLQVELRKVYDD